MFGLGRHEVMGVDIGSSAVKIVQLRKASNHWLVTAAGVVDISAGQDHPLLPPEHLPHVLIPLHVGVTTLVDVLVNVLDLLPDNIGQGER